MQESTTNHEPTTPSPQLLAGFGAVPTPPKLENDAKIREEFEKGVAEEVVSEDGKIRQPFSNTPSS